MRHWLERARREPGMPVSLGLHAAVLVASIVTFSSPKTFEDAQESIPVEVISESAVAEMMKGEREAKPQPTPSPRVDRVADRKEQNAPGAAARQVNAAETPKPQEATAREERAETTAAVTIPLPPARPQPQRPVEPPKPAEPPKAVAVAQPPKPAETSEEEEEAEEAIRQAARKREEQKRQEDARRAEEARRRDEQRKADEAKRQEENRRIEEARRQEESRKAEEARRQEQRLEAQRLEERREQEEARKREEMRKLVEAKAAEAKKAEEAKKAQEAARKAAEERRRREAEQEARNQATAEAARRALLASREMPQNSGNTGAQVTRTPASLGTPTATGQRLSPSDRAALAGLLSDQIRACWSIPVTGKPPTLPQVRVALNADGSLGAAPVLINSSGDSNFRALAESGMRAIRQCAPFRIPQRYAATYEDWRQLAVQLNPDD
jgi:colicin import membrane protein